MEEKSVFGQPLMMRKDYGKTEDKKDKDAVMFKSVPIENYDDVDKKKLDDGYLIEDYDCHECDGGCFLCDR